MTIGRTKTQRDAWPSTTPLVELAGVGREFRGVPVVSAVDLTVGAGDIHALIGPNGAGKTTLLRMIAGLLSPSSGRLTVMGRPPTDPTTRSDVGWVPAGDRTFYMRLSGRENLLFYARLQGMGKAAARKRAEEMLDAVDLDGAARRPAGEYSKGMLKRLGIARALLTEPDLLLFDEATHDLDLEGAEAVRSIVQQMAARGSGVVWATQRLEELPGLAQTVTVLGRGGSLFDGTVDRLVSEASVRSFIVRIGSEPPTELLGRLARDLSVRSRVAHVPSVEAHRLLIELGEGDHLGRVIGMLEQGGCRVISCTEQEAEIRLAFRSLTERS